MLALLATRRGQGEYRCRRASSHYSRISVVNLALLLNLMANGMTTDVYHRDNCIFPRSPSHVINSRGAAHREAGVLDTPTV